MQHDRHAFDDIGPRRGAAQALQESRPLKNNAGQRETAGRHKPFTCRQGRRCDTHGAGQPIRSGAVTDNRLGNVLRSETARRELGVGHPRKRLEAVGEGARLIDPVDEVTDTGGDALQQGRGPLTSWERAMVVIGNPLSIVMRFLHDQNIGWYSKEITVSYCIAAIVPRMTRFIFP